MKDEFKRAMYDGKYSYCSCWCCNTDPPKGKARQKLRHDTRRQLLQELTRLTEEFGGYDAERGCEKHG